MIKRVSALLLLMALSGCNYFSTEEEIKEKAEASIVPGNAQAMITQAAKSRGYETVWDLKGNYSLSDADLMNVKGKNFGEALTIFQGTFTQNNLKLGAHKELNGKPLGYHPYVLFLICKGLFALAVSLYFPGVLSSLRITSSGFKISASIANSLFPIKCILNT